MSNVQNFFKVLCGWQSKDAGDQFLSFSECRSVLNDIYGFSSFLAEFWTVDFFFALWTTLGKTEPGKAVPPPKKTQVERMVEDLTRDLKHLPSNFRRLEGDRCVVCLSACCQLFAGVICVHLPPPHSSSATSFLLCVSSPIRRPTFLSFQQLSNG